MGTPRWTADWEIGRAARPKDDGERNEFDSNAYELFFCPPWGAGADSGGVERVARRRYHRSGRYRVAFVNGVKASPEKHAAQALAVSAITGGTVTGIYNASDGLMRDLWQSVLDKATPSDGLRLMTMDSSFRSDDEVRSRLRRLLAKANRATATLFDFLAEPSYVPARIVAHSQGCIIASNALNALLALRGREVLDWVRVYAIGSPVMFWGEARKVVREFRYANDPFGWLAPRSGRRSAYAVGYSAVSQDANEIVSGFEPSWNPFQLFSHSFYIYLAQLWDDLQREFP